LWNYSMELGGEGRGKENDREWTMWKYIAAVQEDDIKIHTERCWIIGDRREGESNKGV
jgi:hypothetical protein